MLLRDKGKHQGPLREDGRVRVKNRGKVGMRGGASAFLNSQTSQRTEVS